MSTTKTKRTKEILASLRITSIEQLLKYCKDFRGHLCDKQTTILDASEPLKIIWDGMERFGDEVPKRPSDLIGATKAKLLAEMLTNNATERLHCELNKAVEWCRSKLAPKPILRGDILEVDGQKYRLEDQEVNVLGAIAEKGAMTKTELENRSGQSNAVAILRKLRKKYPQLNIRTPGSKGKGGYTAHVTSTQ